MELLTTCALRVTQVRPSRRTYKSSCNDSLWQSLKNPISGRTVKDAALIRKHKCIKGEETEQMVKSVRNGNSFPGDIGGATSVKFRNYSHGYDHTSSSFRNSTVTYLEVGLHGIITD